MKQLITTLTCVILAISSFANPPSAKEVLQKAMNEARKEHKKVFLIFHASWCIWCHRMDTAMNEPAFKPMFERNFVITHLDFLEQDGKKGLENDGTSDVLNKLIGKKQGGIPVWVILDANGTRLADSFMEDGNNTGCPSSGPETEYFGKVLAANTSLTPQQIVAIKTRFRKFD